jgi:hypothetical protein
VTVLFIVKRGRFRLFRTVPDGHAVTTALPGPGAIFGEMDLLGLQMRGTWAEALDGGDLCLMSRAEVRHMLLSDARIATRIAEQLGAAGAAVAVALTVPSLKNKFDGLSVRVPTPVVSLSDVTILFKNNVTKEEINETLKKAAADPFYQGILDYSEQPLVSGDYIGNSHSGTVDSLLTNVVGGNLAKVVVWYDNEWGYSNRLVEVVADTGRLLHGKHEK